MGPCRVPPAAQATRGGPLPLRGHRPGRSPRGELVSLTINHEQESVDLDEILAERGRRGLTGMELACFGHEDSEQIMATLAPVLEGLGAPTQVLHYSVSIGVVLGLLLDSGTRVAVKAFPPFHEPKFLAAANQVRERLHAGGYPAPRLISDVVRVGHGFAWVEEWLEAPAPCEPAAIVTPLARELAHLLELCRPLGRPDTLRLSWQTFDPPVGIWRRPARPDVSMYGPPSGGWIEEIARSGRADAQAAPGPELVGHVDWRPDNVRLGLGGALAAVFDWDSIQLTGQVHYVAGACSGLEPESMASFLAAFEEASGLPLSRPERLAVAGRVIWSHAIWARYEQVRGLPPEQQRFLPRLRDDAGTYRLAATA